MSDHFDKCQKKFYLVLTCVQALFSYYMHALAMYMILCYMTQETHNNIGFVIKIYSTFIASKSSTNTLHEKFDIFIKDIDTPLVLIVNASHLVHVVCCWKTYCAFREDTNFIAMPVFTSYSHACMAMSFGLLACLWGDSNRNKPFVSTLLSTDWMQKKYQFLAVHVHGSSSTYLDCMLPGVWVTAGLGIGYDYPAWLPA